ncbi:MAG: hypothetical protein ACRDD7_03460 [Peptostreptococcaceae bacterium]
MGNKVPSTVRLDEYDDNTINLLSNVTGHAKGAMLRELVKVGLSTIVGNNSNSGNVNIGNININNININNLSINSLDGEDLNDGPLIIDIDVD